ncbi:hypothetical protein [Rubinisphaera italica]|uniref:Uncharacterized protein n=1 Tax=Rubinisphaera italica TaxID=2527969 RepID=A0A5C5X9M5_9PLAN|nr:hypothetical protein [Rubinisphaera italica]TWT59650.1 hypothetical protein Pan54_03580 [Rubinisphaera italica]
MSEYVSEKIVVNSDVMTIEAGAYEAKFIGMTDWLINEKSDKQTIYRRFDFEGEEGIKYAAFADKPKMAPRSANKYGRFLLGLSGRAANSTDLCEIDPSEFVGKKYQLIYAPNTKGNVALSAFTMMR